MHKREAGEEFAQIFLQKSCKPCPPRGSLSSHNAAGELKGRQCPHQSADLGLGARVNGRYRLRRASLALV